MLKRAKTDLHKLNNPRYFYQSPSEMPDFAEVVPGKLYLGSPDSLSKTIVDRYEKTAKEAEVKLLRKLLRFYQ